MPSRTSKPSRPKAGRSFRTFKDALGCSEAELPAIAADLAAQLRPGDRVLLEGPMGAGKSTFARALLRALEVVQPPEGSPTFALVHEYDSPRGRIAHLDLYRLKSDSELEDSGINEGIWDPTRISLIEWASMFPALLAALERSTEAGLWQVNLGFHPEIPELRNIAVLSRSGT